MTRRAVEIPPLRSPSGEIVVGRVSVELVDGNGIPILGTDDDGDPITDRATITTSSETQTISLTTTDSVAPAAQYLVTVETPGHMRNRSHRFFSALPSGSGTLPWTDFAAFEAGLQRGELLLNRMLPDPADLPDGYIAIVRDGAWEGTDEYPAGPASSAVSAHNSAFDHSKIATALQPSDVGTAAAEDSEAFDPAGSASSAVSAHNSAFDHSKIATSEG